MKKVLLFVCLICVVGLGAVLINQSQDQPESPSTGIHESQILEGDTGTIHYSYYLPDNYSEEKKYPLVSAVPGYDMMWFSEESDGSNLNWDGFLCWQNLDEDMIVVSPQLTDWQERSANQAIELTEYFINNFSVDTDRVYATGYSAGGETMSQAVSLRPDLYTAYLHGASQWDGIYDPVVQEPVNVYIYMAENDEYYGSEKAREAYQNLYDAYLANGYSQTEIDQLLQVQIPDNEYFVQHGINNNYHGGATIVYQDTDVLNWIISKSK